MEASDRTRAFAAWCSTQTGDYNFSDHWRCPLARFGAAVMRTGTEPPMGYWDGWAASEWPIGTSTGFIPSPESGRVVDLTLSPGHVKVITGIAIHRFGSYEDLNVELQRRLAQ